jgi:hypothetical protein
VYNFVNFHKSYKMKDTGNKLHLSNSNNKFVHRINKEEEACWKGLCRSRKISCLSKFGIHLDKVNINLKKNSNNILIHMMCIQAIFYGPDSHKSRIHFHLYKCCKLIDMPDKQLFLNRKNYFRIYSLHWKVYLSQNMIQGIKNLKSS